MKRKVTIDTRFDDDRDISCDNVLKIISRTDDIISIEDTGDEIVISLKRSLVNYDIMKDMKTSILIIENKKGE